MVNFVFGRISLTLKSFMSTSSALSHLKTANGPFRKIIRKIRTDQSCNELSFLNARVHVDVFLYEYAGEHVLVHHGDVYDTLYVIMNSRKQFLQSLLQKELL